MIVAVEGLPDLIKVILYPATTGNTELRTTLFNKVLLANFFSFLELNFSCFELLYKYH